MRETKGEKRVLVLGAGLVARPLVRYLLEQAGATVTVASRTVSKAEALIEDHPSGRALALDVDDRETLESLVRDHDLAVSLLPAPFHPVVAELCLKYDKDMATTSYISPAMRALDGQARAKGLTFLNECGVDPGIDHMTAMRIFDDVWARGGRVVSFKSYCGGLPAPEANDNPLGYKFSWAPKGVLVAARNSALYLWDGEQVEVPGPELFADMHEIEVGGAGRFEAYPNRDSLSYLDTYGLKHVHTMYRGTLRNLGHCARWKAWVDLGLFADAYPALASSTYAGLMRALVGAAPDADPRAAVAERMGVTPDADAVATLDWLGMFSDDPLPSGGPIDALAAAMLARMEYAPGERDMIAMHHEVESELPDGKETTTMDLVDFGIPNGDSSMARTVSLPVAIGVRMILEGRFPQKGVVAPVAKDVYTPILDELETLGIVCKETTVRS